MWQLPLLIRHYSAYCFIVIALITIPILGCVLLAKPSLSEVSLSDYQTYQCDINGADQNQKTFRILTLASIYALEIADSLCQSQALATEYSSVEISWQARAFLQPQDILTTHYELFWNRRHIVLGLVPETLDYYRVIADTPHYQLYWLSRGSEAELTQAYLSDKVIGFSKDQQSQTYFLQPMNALRHAGIKLKTEQKRFYPTPSSLYKAFLTGDVDIISTSKMFALNLDQADMKFSLLANNVPSGSWFLHQGVKNPDISCAILNAISLMSPLFKQPLHPLAGESCNE